MHSSSHELFRGSRQGAEFRKRKLSLLALMVVCEINIPKVMCMLDNSGLFYEQ